MKRAHLDDGGHQVRPVHQVAGFDDAHEPDDELLKDPRAGRQHVEEK